MKQSKGKWTIAKTTMAVLACGLIAGTAFADDVQVADAPTWYPFTIGVDGGFEGLGGNASWRIMDHLGVRAGIHDFSYNHSGTIEDAYYTTKVQLTQVPVTLDWYPYKNTSLHISAGVAFNFNKITGSANGGSQNITINGNTYTAGQIGTLNLEIKQKLVNGYLSIGGNLFYFDKRHHWAFTGELGAMYGGKPSTSLTASGVTLQGAARQQFNHDLAVEQTKVQHYANYLQGWPVLQLGVSFGF